MEKKDANESFEIFHTTLKNLHKAHFLKGKAVKNERKNAPIYLWATDSSFRYINKTNKLWTGYCSL